MSGPLPLWIDWKLAGRRMRRESALRFVALLFLSFVFLVLLFSGGTNRYLSGQWTITALLRPGVSDEEGEGLARKAAALPSALGAAYRSPQQAWEEFSAQYPGLETLRSGGGNPLPGYVEITLRHDRLSEPGMEEILSALRPLSQVERLLYGGDAMPLLFRWKRIANGVLWGGFGVLALLFFLGFVLQERARAAALSSDFAFLRERGTPGGQIARGRAAGAALAAFLLTLAAGSLAAAFLSLLSGRFRAVRLGVGSPEDAADPAYLLPVALFLLAPAALAATASLLGWRASGGSAPE